MVSHMAKHPQATWEQRDSPNDIEPRHAHKQHLPGQEASKTMLSFTTSGIGAPTCWRWQCKQCEISAQEQDWHLGPHKRLDITAEEGAHTIAIEERATRAWFHEAACHHINTRPSASLPQRVLEQDRGSQALVSNHELAMRSFECKAYRLQSKHDAQTKMHNIPASMPARKRTRQRLDT